MADTIIGFADQERLRAELQAVKYKGVLCAGSNSRSCARCRTELGRIINRGAICRWCRHRVCKSCRQYVSNETSVWLCTVCHKQMELTAATGDWMSQFVQCPDKTAVDSVKRSLHRSWTFSDATPSPWAALRNSPEMRAYSSMPRHQDCEFIGHTAFISQPTPDKREQTIKDQTFADQKAEHPAAENLVELDNCSVAESNVATVDIIVTDSDVVVDENSSNVLITDNESNNGISSPFVEAQNLNEITVLNSPSVSAEETVSTKKGSIDDSSVSTEENVSTNKGSIDDPSVSTEENVSTNKRSIDDAVIEPLTGTMFRKVTLKKRRVDSRNLPPGVTPPRSRRAVVPRSQDDADFLRDRDDYRLVFISSSDSSSREELQSDDGDGSSTVAGGDCEWDYFEPGGAGGGVTVAAAPQSTAGPLGVPVPIPVPVPVLVPVPVFVPVPWTPDLTIRVQHLWSMQQFITVTLDRQMSQRLDLLTSLSRDSNDEPRDKTSTKRDSEVIVSAVESGVDQLDNASCVEGESFQNSVDNDSSVIKCSGGNGTGEPGVEGVVFKHYKPLSCTDLEAGAIKGSSEPSGECLQYSMEEAGDGFSSSSDESESDKSSKRIYKLNDEEESEEERSNDEDSSGEFSMVSSLSSSPGSGKFKRVYVVNESDDSDLGELPEFNDDSEGEVTLLSHVVMDEVRLSTILQDSLEPDLRISIEDKSVDNTRNDNNVTLESILIGPDVVHTAENKLKTEEFLKKEIEFNSRGVPRVGVEAAPAEVGSDEECTKQSETRGSNTSDEFSGTESMELEQGQIRPVVPVSAAGESWRETGRYTSLVMITQDHLEPVSVVTSDTTTLVTSLDSEVQVVTGNGATAAVILEEGLPDDDSWVEDLDRDELLTTTEDSSEDDSCYVDREEELRGYHPRSAIDFTLHTIVEESCEESEVEVCQNRHTELEKYFFYGVGDGSSEFREVDTMSETSSIHSEGLESIGGYDDVAEDGKDPAELASSRLEKYFLSGLLGCSRRDSDGSVGSDSEGKPSPEQRRKRLVRARGTGRQHSSSQDNLNEAEQQDELQVESEDSSTETDSYDDLSNSFEKSDGQFDTVKRTKKKKRSVVSAPSLELLEVTEEVAGVSESREDLHSSDGNKTPQPEFALPPDTSCNRNKHQSRDSGFIGSCDDLIKENKDLHSSEVVGIVEEESEKVPELNKIDEAVITLTKVSPSTDLIRKDSFNNWSSDEETNLMMSKMRQFFKTMVASQPKVASPVESRSKPPQLVHFESELTRLMKTVPGIRDEQVKEIVEYLSSEDTWSDSYDSSDYTSSDLEGGNKKTALQEEISASCRQIISNFETVPEIPSTSSETGDGINKDTAFVYQRLVASFSKLDTPTADSPPLIAKVMQHIGSRLVALMHEVSSADGGSPKTARYHKRLQPKLSTTSTEDEEDSIDDYTPLPRSKSHDPLIEENRQEASDNERFSWRGSFESALMASDSRTRLASSGGEGSVSASALALAAKRRSAGDLLFKTCSREQLDRVRSCGSIGGSVEDKIWALRHQKRRRSSVPDSGGSNDGDDDSEEEVDNGKSTTLPRSLQSSCAATNSLPRLPTTPASPSIYKAHSASVVSARYRPPGYGSRGTAIAPRRRSTQTPSPSPLPALVGDDASVCSETVSVRALEEDDRLHTSRTSSLGARSDSLASVYSGAGEGRYGSVAVRGEVEFGLQYNYRQGALEIYVKQCRDLAAVDTKRNRSDPYVKVYLLPDKSKSGKRKTRVKKHTLNPVFEETLKFHISLEGLESRTLWLSVWHSDMFGRNDFLGEVTMTLENKVFDDPLPKFYTLQERTEPLEELLSSKGELIVGLKFVPPELNSGKKNSSKGCLQVLVKEAKNLVAVKSNGTSDPFCKSYLLPDKGRSSKQKTGVVRKCTSPVWNHTFTYPGMTLESLACRSLELTIWDHDRLASNEFLGGVRLNLGSGKHNGKPVDWMDASGKETTLWQRMLERPNLWVESCLSLRPSLDLRNN